MRNENFLLCTFFLICWIIKFRWFCAVSVHKTYAIISIREWNRDEMRRKKLIVFAVPHAQMRTHHPPIFLNSEWKTEKRTNQWMNVEIHEMKKNVTWTWNGCTWIYVSAQWHHHHLQTDARCTLVLCSMWREANVCPILTCYHNNMNKSNETVICMCYVIVIGPANTLRNLAGSPSKRVTMCDGLETAGVHCIEYTSRVHCKTLYWYML